MLVFECLIAGSSLSHALPSDDHIETPPQMSIRSVELH